MARTPKTPGKLAETLPDALPDKLDETDLDQARGGISTRAAGQFVLPEVEDEVLVGFLDGDPRGPVIVGGLWNGRDSPPPEKDD